MVHYKVAPRRSWPWWRWVLTGLSTLALVLSIFLSWHSLAGGALIGCGGGSSCDQVLTSRWSTIWGVLPVSGLAAGAYMAMLVASVFIGPATEAPVRRLAWGAMLVLVGSAAGSAVWFIILQKWVIRAFCPYCMTAHITGLLLAMLIIWQARLHVNAATTTILPTGPASGSPKTTSTVTPESPSAPRTGDGRFPTIRLALVGMALAGGLAVFQSIVTPPSAYLDGESQTAAPIIDPHAAPLVGSPDAAYIVNVLFDYNCPHCQKLHFMLDEAIRRYDGKLAFVLCPTPLNPQCNPYIPQYLDEYKESCGLANVALAVWVANREAFSEFNRWMFMLESGDRWRPRNLDAATAKAVELIGKASLDKALSDPWIDQYIQASLRIYGNTGNTAVPKLVYGALWVTPEPNDADGLISILQNSLALPIP